MKTIFILLLGFGGTFPMVCGKKESKPKPESELKEKQTTPSPNKNLKPSLGLNNWTLSNYNKLEIYS